MNNYEAKLEAKRERLLERAEKARSEATDAGEARQRISGMIPMGQPILVGHHSERRHRRDIERIDRAFAKQHEAYEKAKRLERQAAGVGRGGVSSDDPDAIAKLRVQLASDEASRAAGKAVNKLIGAAVRKARKTVGEDGSLDYEAIVRSLDLGAADERAMVAACRMYQGYRAPKYDFANISANIRRLKARIQELEAAEERPEAEAIEGAGFRIEEDKEANRVRIYFDEKPNKEARTLLKSEAFRWAPSVGVWQRQLTTNGVAAAQRVARRLNVSLAPTIG